MYIYIYIHSNIFSPESEKKHQALPPQTTDTHSTLHHTLSPCDTNCLPYASLHPACPPLESYVTQMNTVDITHAKLYVFLRLSMTVRP